jgi:fucose 4-O-acetylase-like acetyltransferase
VAKVTIAFGILLIILGIVGFVETGSQHPTALIPTYFGIVFGILGLLVTFKPTTKKHAMHAAATLALLGFLGTITGLIKSIQWLAGTAPARPAAVISQSIMAVMCVIFVLLCVRSFINARKNRIAQNV